MIRSKKGGKMTEKEKEALDFVRRGISIEEAARRTGVNGYWLSLKTGKGN